MDSCYRIRQVRKNNQVRSKNPCSHYRKDKNRWDDMSFLLEEWSGRKNSAGEYIDGEASAWRPDLGAVRATVDFARKIGRFNPEGQAGRSETT